MVSAKIIAIGLCTGILIGLGWWAFFDGVVYAPDAFPWSHIVPALGSVLALIMLNLVTIEQLKQLPAVRVWTFISLTLGCICVGGAIWITAAEYPPALVDNWPGVSIIVQTMLVLIAGVLLFVGRSSMDSNKLYSM